MKRDEYQLFSDGKISYLRVKNRLVRSATYEGSMTEDGKVTEDLLKALKERL